jgi:hypothetical protein
MSMDNKPHVDDKPHATSRMLNKFSVPTVVTIAHLTIVRTITQRTHLTITQRPHVNIATPDTRRWFRTIHACSEFNGWTIAVQDGPEPAHAPNSIAVTPSAVWCNAPV